MGRSKAPLSFKRLPKGVQEAGALRVQRQLERGGRVTDILYVSDKKWRRAQDVFRTTERLSKIKGPRAWPIKLASFQYQVTTRTVERWLRNYRRNPDIMALVPRARGPRPGDRRLLPEQERLLTEVIGDWARRPPGMPVSWIVEECHRRGKARRIAPPSRNTVLGRLRDQGLQSLQRRYAVPIPEVPKPPGKPPRSPTPLAIMQMDHTLVDVMVVDEIGRKSLGRPWVTIGFDIASRCVLGFHLSLHAPSAVSVGMTLAMAGLPKDAWLAERELVLDWPMYGLPKVLHVDNGVEFHSDALVRGCERYGIELAYRPPGRPHFGGHIERYLGTLMARIHGLPGTTYSSPQQRGKYKSQAKATMTMAELEKWIALEIGGRYHHFVNTGIHGIPLKVWKRRLDTARRRPIADPNRFVIDFLPVDLRKVGRDGFQVGRIRYWDPLVARLFPNGTRVLVRSNPRDLSKVFVPAPDQSGYLTIPYADLRRPPITLAELERSRSILSDKGDRAPSEDAIFATAEAQRALENAAAKKTGRARRRVEQRPPQPGLKTLKASRAAAKVNWNAPVEAAKAEVW